MIYLSFVFLGIKILVENSGYKKLAREKFGGIIGQSPKGIVITYCRNYHNVSSISIKPIYSYKLMPDGTAIGYVNGKLIVSHLKQLNEYAYINGGWKLLGSQNAIGCFSRRQSASCELDQSKILIVGGLWHEKCVSIIHVKSHMEEQHLDQYEGNSSNDITEYTNTDHGVKITKCRTKLPVEMCKHSITQISPGTVIAIGGWLKGGISNRVFMGKYIQKEDNVEWTELSPLKHGSSSHIAFKIGKKLIVAGGWGPNFTRFDSSHIFCLEKNSWLPGPKLPFPLSNASVVVHESEQFALIFGGIADDGVPSRTIIVYTPENGFVAHDKMIKFNRVNNKLIKVGQHIRVM